MKKSPKAKMDWFALKSSAFVKWAAAYLRRKNWPGSEASIFPRSYSELADDSVLCCIFKDHVTKSEESFASEYQLISNMKNAWDGIAKQKKASRGKVRINVSIQPDLKLRLDKYKEEKKASRLAEAIEELIRNIDGNKFIQNKNSNETSKLLAEISRLSDINKSLTDELNQIKIEHGISNLNYNNQTNDSIEINESEKTTPHFSPVTADFAKSIRNHGK